MAFCSQCGRELTADMRFCPGCGAAAASASAASANTQYTYTAGNQYAEQPIFKVILLSTGLCSTVNAVALLQDVLGYNNADAHLLVRTAPVEIARRLTITQAQYVAQALTEYGLEVSVTNAAGEYIDTSACAASSIFDAAGNFLPQAAAVLGLLGIGNRVSHIARWRHPGPPPPLFRLGFRRPYPLMYRRPSFLHRPPAPHRPMARPHGMGMSRPGGMGRPGGGMGMGGSGSRPGGGMGMGGPGPRGGGMGMGGPGPRGGGMGRPVGGGMGRGRR